MRAISGEARILLAGWWLRRRFAWSRLAEEVENAVRQQRQLRDLRQLDDRLLRDLGIRREEAILGRPLGARRLGGRP